MHILPFAFLMAIEYANHNFSMPIHRQYVIIVAQVQFIALFLIISFSDQFNSNITFKEFGAGKKSFVWMGPKPMVYITQPE